MASAAHAYQATLTSQDSRGTKKASPKTSPMTNEARSPWRYSAITSRAGPAAASGQNPTGGNAATRATPPASGGQQGPGQPQPVPPQPGQARGDAAGHGGNPPGGGHAAGAALRDLPHGQSVAGYAGLSRRHRGHLDLAGRPVLVRCRVYDLFHQES